MSKKRNLIITGTVGVAVILGFVALRGFKVPPEGTEGAIGAANRYQTEQISAKDVKLQDAEIQAFLQSDTFHKLATNAEFRKLAMEKSFQETARMEAYRNIMVDRSQALSLANKDFAQYLVQPATVAMITSEAFVKVASECNMSELLRMPMVYQLISSALEKKWTAVEFRQEVQRSSSQLSQSFVQAVSKNAEMVLAALPQALLEGREMLLNQKGAAELLAGRGVGAVLESKAFADVMALDAHEELMKHPEVMELAFRSEAFRTIAETQRWAELDRGFALEQQ